MTLCARASLELEKHSLLAEAESLKAAAISKDLSAAVTRSKPIEGQRCDWIVCEKNGRRVLIGTNKGSPTFRFVVDIEDGTHYVD